MKFAHSPLILNVNFFIWIQKCDYSLMTKKVKDISPSMRASSFVFDPLEV
jgi:hypothetical protein